MNNIFTICYSEEEANEIGHFIMRKAMKVFKMIVTDIAVKQFGGLLKKLKDIIRVSYMLALEIVK
mgnify:CR=1 FL=1